MWSSIAKAIAALFSFITKRNEDKNAPDVKAAAKANRENAAVEAETKAVIEENENEIRKNLSE